MKGKRNKGKKSKGKKKDEDDEANLEIREMRKEDTQAVIKIIKETMLADDIRVAKRTFKRYFQPEANFPTKYWVAVQEGEVIGITGFYQHLNSFWLGWFAVKSKYQRNGLGKVLLAKTEEAGRKLSWKELWVLTSSLPEFARARRFYKKEGFKETELPNYPWQEEDTLILKKEL